MLADFYRKVQYLSLDIVLGAVILLRFFSIQLAADIEPIVYLLLAGSVWSIYTVDHLRDAKLAIKGDRGRYQYHLRNRRGLLLVLGMVLVACVGSLFLIAQPLLINGAILAISAMAYLLVNQFLSRVGAKEIYIALVYSSGILIAPFTLVHEIKWDFLFLLSLLSFANLILFSWFEEQEDKEDKFRSISTAMGQRLTEKVILVTLALGIASTLLLTGTVVSLYFLLAFGVYAFLIVNHQWSEQKLRYRLIGDGVFMLPAVMLWI